VTVTLTRAGMPCDNCGLPLVTERDAVPWCGRCGWNLEVYEPKRRRQELRWKWADRWSFTAAYELNMRQFSDLSGRPVDKPGVSGVRIALTAIAVVMLTLVLALGAGGILLMIYANYWFEWIPAILAVLVSIVLLPRFGRLGRFEVPIEPNAVPQLSALIRDVAAAAGAPVPHQLIMSDRFNASIGTYGLRRRRVLNIGLPLWLSLAPQERVALLGHELGHSVNGDVRRLLLTRFAFDVFKKLVYLTTPDRGRSRYSRRTSSVGGLAVLGDLVSRWVLAVFCLIFTACGLFVDWLGMRVSHQSEYTADVLAVRLGGSAAAASMLDALVQRDTCLTALQRTVRSDPAPANWRSEIERARAHARERIERLRQLSIRDEASLFRSHPPTGLRVRLIESRAPEPASVVCEPARSDRIDAELAPYYGALRRELANSTLR
jgi:heat shock protein HtpX